MAVILVIDDELGMRQMVRRILLSAKHSVVEAKDGVFGLEQFRKHRPAIVITDILMPEMEGIETIKQARALDPSVKVIAISGGGAAHNMKFLDMAKMLGANLVLAKPFRAAELLAAVDRLSAPVTGS